MVMHHDLGGWEEPAPMLMQLCTWAGFLVCIGFMSVSLASGLYYIAELAEENSVMARRILKYWILLVIVANVLLLISSSISFMLGAVSIVAQICYSALLKDYPFTKLSDPAVTLSCICFVIDTVLWYNYFTDYDTPSYSVFQITGFFALFVWPVPFGFFITLSLSDQGLPGLGSINNQGDGFGDFKKRRGILSVFDYLFKKEPSSSFTKGY
eukprot:TRINITY_DN3115_c0_g1_i5.p1 TRINITY_DN3115_c0_g1~~TRINITY_DN3115_c0_g1_i5.p1  ORF type:complete len:211 (+),score=27.66 TRINITY_DN3115_c0_g1_i5:47-679(+)